MRAILHPVQWLALRRADELAATIAVRQAILREIVRLHVERYVRHGHLEERVDRDRAIALAAQVIQQLQPRFNWANTNPEDQAVRTEIAKAVTMTVVPLPVWIALRELRAAEPVDPQLHMTLSYRAGGVGANHWTSQVAAIQKHFPFFEVFDFTTPVLGSPALARVAPEMSRMADERLKSERVDLVRFGLPAR